MADPKFKVKKPINALNKPITLDVKAIFKALAKGIGHGVGGKWEELANDSVEALSAIGLATEPGELAYLLLRRSMTRALFDLVGESASQLTIEMTEDESEVLNQLDFSIYTDGVRLDSKFLDRPGDLAIIADLEVLLVEWLIRRGVSRHAAEAIAERFPSYFVFALNQEWRRNSKSYAPISAAIETPFTKAGEREWAWAAYSAMLQRRIHEGVFDEPFSLSQIYVPLNSFYVQEDAAKRKNEDIATSGRRIRRVVVDLQKELDEWLKGADKDDSIRVISGGPGSGKSSFLRILAAKVAEKGTLKVLFVPLHLMDPTKDLVDEVGRFVRDEGILLQNPLDPDSPEKNLLIIFDGLDELASQGKAAAETARAFIREVEKTAEKRNMQKRSLRIVISGRELVVQENESEFRKDRQVLTLLPYFDSRGDQRLTDRVRHSIGSLVRDEEEYVDAGNLLKIDLRRAWWKGYGKLTGREYPELPRELARQDLEEITGQPLLNYLLALSFTRDELDFKKDVGLNAIYFDLVSAVYERAYDKKRRYAPIRHMKFDDFIRVLEEIGLAAWHGDGRTTTVREIEEHCRTSGVDTLLGSFEEGAKAGVTKLLAAFFFRQHGQRQSGDPTFVFTHKSFGEYLAARRIARCVDKVVRELESRAEDLDSGWDPREALKHWAQVCGPSPISIYLHPFLLGEIANRDGEAVKRSQSRLEVLFALMLKNGMPMERLQFKTFKEAMFESRNAEEALLVALNACARITRRASSLGPIDATAFGAWFRRIQGQRIGAESVLAAKCLSFLDLRGFYLHNGDFYGANLEHSKLSNVWAAYACFGAANLAGAECQGAHTVRVLFQNSDLTGANFEGANLAQAQFVRSDLAGTNFRGSKLEGAVLEKNEGIKPEAFTGAETKGITIEAGLLRMIRDAHGKRVPKLGASDKTEAPEETKA
jgi:uncharacterized protein YjbI with pentapeptide repeats